MFLLGGGTPRKDHFPVKKTSQGLNIGKAKKKEPSLIKVAVLPSGML